MCEISRLDERSAAKICETCMGLTKEIKHNFDDGKTAEHYVSSLKRRCVYWTYVQDQNIIQLHIFVP